MKIFTKILETALGHYKFDKPKAKWRELLTTILQCFCVSVASSTLSIWANTENFTKQCSNGICNSENPFHILRKLSPSEEEEMYWAIEIQRENCIELCNFFSLLACVEGCIYMWLFLLIFYIFGFELYHFGGWSPPSMNFRNWVFGN